MTINSTQEFYDAMVEIALQVDISSCTIDNIEETASLGVRQFRPEVKEICEAYNSFVEEYNSRPENADNQLSPTTYDKLIDQIVGAVYALNDDMVGSLSAQRVEDRLTYSTDSVVTAEKTGSIIAIPVQATLEETLALFKAAGIVAAIDGRSNSPENPDIVLKSSEGGVSFSTQAQGGIDEVNFEFAAIGAVIAIRANDDRTPSRNEDNSLNAWTIKADRYASKYEKPDEKGFSKPAGGIQIFARFTEDTKMFNNWGEDFNQKVSEKYKYLFKEKSNGPVPQMLKANAYFNLTNINDVYGVNNVAVTDKETGEIKPGEFDATYKILSSVDVLCLDELYNAAIKAGANYMIPEVKAQIDEFVEMMVVPAHQLLMNHNGQLNEAAISLVQNILVTDAAIALDAISSGDWEGCKEMLKPHAERIDMVIQNAAGKSQEKSKDPAEKTDKPKEAAKPNTKDKNNDDREM